MDTATIFFSTKLLKFHRELWLLFMLQYAISILFHIHYVSAKRERLYGIFPIYVNVSYDNVTIMTMHA